jgi:hypothetical protein
MDEPAPPRCRIEYRHPDLSPLIVAFADTIPVGVDRLLAARRRLRLIGETGSVGIVLQDGDRDIREQAIVPTPPAGQNVVAEPASWEAPGTPGGSSGGGERD